MASIWEGSGRVWGVSWALLGALGLFFRRSKTYFFKALVQDGLQEAFWIDFGAVLGGFGEGFGRPKPLIFAVFSMKFFVLRTYRRPNKPPKSSFGAQKPSKMSPQIDFRAKKLHKMSPKSIKNIIAAFSRKICAPCRRLPPSQEADPFVTNPPR